MEKSFPDATNHEKLLVNSWKLEILWPQKYWFRRFEKKPRNPYFPKAARWLMISQVWESPPQLPWASIFFICIMGVGTVPPLRLGKGAQEKTCAQFLAHSSALLSVSRGAWAPGLCQIPSQSLDTGCERDECVSRFTDSVWGQRDDSAREIYRRTLSQCLMLWVCHQTPRGDHLQRVAKVWSHSLDLKNRLYFLGLQNHYRW